MQPERASGDPHEPEDPPLLSIIIPAFDEEDRIGTTLDAAGRFLAAEGLSAEVVVVDDGSRDSTIDRVEERREGFPAPLRVLKEPHRGKGGAVKAGMLAARGRRRMLCDADLAMEFEEIPRFLERVEAGVDVVLGSREAPGARREDEPWHRHVIGRFFNYFVRVLAVRGVQDTQCGYKLFTAESAEAIFRRTTIHGFAFDVEALFLARRLGFRFEELPILWRSVERSKVHPVRDGFRMFAQVLSIRWKGLAGRYR